ncbi:TPA: glycosyltransferase family 4 protein [Vibrio diabolicus]|uniref:glycosyltransferase family 4 protein n=1 Tax=Vibrio diabolicus TaxID=50719 RepID=UPI0029407251|nr:glycosyltransferase [Vibrio diabolicus]EHV9685140.1 glycosyltransferase [Vibrio parahaemolyticus]MDV5085853.1 glycosyltransferase [Vibrio diabolicus]
MKIHIVGALPGPLGGTTILLKQLVDDIKNDSSVSLIISDTSLVRNLSLFGKVKFLFSTLRNTLSSDITSVHVSAKGSITITPILLFLCLASKKRFNFRMFGGVYDKFFTNSSKTVKGVVSFIINKSDLIYFETNHLVEYFREKFPHANIKHYTNSRPSTLLRSDVIKENKFVFLGAIKRSKGVNTILEAAKYLPSVEIDFYGPIIEHDLEDAIKRQSNCSYKGVCQPELILDVLKNYKCLLLPTEHFGEGYPGVIIEAYSLGIPVITTEWQCIPEIVEVGRTGFLVKPSNPEELAKKVQDVIDMDSDNYKQIKNNCLDFFSSKFDSELLSREFISNLRMLEVRND